MKKILMFMLLVAALPAYAGTVTGDLRFEQVQLGASPRTLRVWLPPGYSSTTTTRYPVVYMWDGQNLFDTATTAFGSEWKVDETLTSFVNSGQTQGAIVVGIDNEGTGKGRYEEYTNWNWTHPTVGFINARADETAAWLVNSVMPLINSKYRTLKGRNYTALAGSSMGGYMTIYTGMAYPKVFGKLASFSTVALDNPMQGQQLRAFVEAARTDPARSPYIAGTQIYLDMGDAEQLSYTTSPLLVENHRQMCNSLLKAGFYPICRVIPGAAHNEAAWSLRVDDAFRFLNYKSGVFSKTWKQVYVRGTHNGFAAGTSMKLVANDTWETTVTFGAGSNERFKFDLNGDWQNTLGDSNKDGVAEAGGADILVTQGAGSYRIRIHEQMLSYSVVRVDGNQAPLAAAGPDQSINSTTSVSVTLDGSASSDADGSISSWLWAEWINGAWQAVGSSARLTLAAVTPGEHRYRLTVTDNQGASAADEVLVRVGASWTQLYPQVYVRGTHNNWGLTTTMQLVANNTWEVVATFGAATTERFKFDVYGDWKTNFGDTNKDGTAEAGGGDIPVSGGAGSYLIRFNDQTRVYSVVKQ